jgi:putative oxidoreductase
MRSRRLTTGLRLLLGATMAVVGALKFIRPEFKVADDPTLRAFIASGWLWPLIGGTELLAGVGLLSGFYVPLALLVLAPVTAGILAFSLTHGGEELWVGIIIAAIHISLAWQFLDCYRPLLQPRPGAPNYDQDKHAI